MLNITLLDGKKLKFPGKVNGHDIAKTISPSLAKKALVIKVNDSFKDLSTIIEKDSTVQIITLEDDYGLEVIRHDTAHVLAMAVQELFKDTQVTIGPVIENGFYYDF
ncbi:MAG: TGS domain-containing protein, partial [Candidatus Fonsibacter sp.]